jgi:RNA polymerase sigma-70 factor (ECF subfamily)
MEGTGDAKDMRLVAEALKGQNDSFMALYDRYYPRILAFASRQTGGLSTAEDLAQETFLRAYRSIDSCKNPEAFGDWLFGIARNCVHEWIRDRQKQRRLRPSPAAGGEEDERLAGLVCAIEELPEEMQQVIRLKYEERMTCEQIASRMSRPLGTVRSWLVRGQERLRAVLRVKEKSH